MKRPSLMLQALVVLAMSVLLSGEGAFADDPSTTTNNKKDDGSSETDSSGDSEGKKTWKEKAKSDVGTVARFGRDFASNLGAMGAEGAEPDYKAIQEGLQVAVLEPTEGIRTKGKNAIQRTGRTLKRKFIGKPPRGPTPENQENEPPPKKTNPSTTQKKQSSEVARENSHLEQELAQNTRDIHRAEEKGDKNRVQALENTRRTLLSRERALEAKPGSLNSPPKHSTKAEK